MLKDLRTLKHAAKMCLSCDYVLGNYGLHNECKLLKFLKYINNVMSNSLKKSITCLLLSRFEEIYYTHKLTYKNVVVVVYL